MEHSYRAKMPVSQRAKQFMPFSAVKGLEEAIAEQERKASRVKRMELNEEAIAALNRTLQRLEKGTSVSATYYSAGQYRSVEGSVEKIDAVRQVCVVDGLSIPFENLLTLQVIQEL